MNDKLVELSKCDFTKKDWVHLCIIFDFDEDDEIVYIHTIEDEEFDY